MQLEEVQRLARELLEIHGLNDWNVSIERQWIPSRCGHEFGECDLQAKNIRVQLRKGGGNFRQSVLHQIAHALSFDECGHGANWMKIARDVGCTRPHILKTTRLRRMNRRA